MVFCNPLPSTVTCCEISRHRYNVIIISMRRKIIKENQIYSKLLSWCLPLLAVRVNPAGHHHCLKPFCGRNLQQLVSQTEVNATALIQFSPIRVSMSKITTWPPVKRKQTAL